jgi:hypothetical protein
MAGAKAAVANHPPRYRAGVPSVPNSRHAMCGVGAGFAVNGDRIPAAWSLRRRHRGDEVRVVAEPTSRAGMRICVQADGNKQAGNGI